MDNLFQSLHYQVEKAHTCTKIFYSDFENTWSAAYPLLPGITLFFQHMHTKFIPFTITESYDMIVINYGLAGRSEQTLTDGTLTYVSVGDLAVSTLASQDGFRFPSGMYEGIELSIDVEEFHQSRSRIILPWDLDVNRLKAMCGKDQFVEASHLSYVDHLMHQMWKLSDLDTPNSQAKICILAQDFLRYLLFEEIPEKRYRNLSRTQAEYALEYEGILTSHLAEHISAKAVAKQFHISETSLKNYFQIEFGESVSSYMKRFRMNVAKKLLLTKRDNIAQISQKVGYASPSKFAAAFRSYYGMGPFEYRQKYQSL